MRERELRESLAAAREETELQAVRHAETERELREELEDARRKTREYADMLQNMVDELESEREGRRQAVAMKDEGWEQYESTLEILKEMRLELVAAENETITNFQSVCSMPINSSHTLCGVPIEVLVARGDKTVQGKAAEAVKLGTVTFWLTWETRTLAAARAQGYAGFSKEGARDFLLERLQESGEVDVLAINPLFLHAAGEQAAPRFLGRMSEPGKVMKSQVAWDRLSSEEQETHWLGSKVRKSVKGEIRMLAAWEVYPYLIVDAHKNWDVSSVRMQGPVKGAKVPCLYILCVLFEWCDTR